MDFPLEGWRRGGLRYQPVHDIVQRVNYLHAGRGIGYSITDAVEEERSSQT